MDAVLKDLAGRGDRTTDLSVPPEGPHRPDESIAALLSDPCGVVRVAATFDTDESAKVRTRPALTQTVTQLTGERRVPARGDVPGAHRAVD